MKVTLTLAILLVTVLAAAAAGKGHDETWGSRRPNDILYRTQYVRKNPSSSREVTKDYSFTQGRYPRNITQIVVSDIYAEGLGGYATLVSGGPNHTSAKIHFKSQRGYGLSFLVYIYVN